jgi:hypothetical protein
MVHHVMHAVALYCQHWQQHGASHATNSTPITAILRLDVIERVSLQYDFASHATT